MIRFVVRRAADLTIACACLGIGAVALGVILVASRDPSRGW